MTTQTNAIELLKQEDNQKQFQAIMKLNGKSNDEVIQLAIQEIGYLEAIAMTNKAVMNCKPLSVLLAVKAVMRQNLTLDPYAGLVYVKTRNVNTGTPQSPNWEKVLEIQPTCNGLISIARQCGRILDIKRPQVLKDQATGKVVSGFVEIQLPGTPEPRWEKFEFDADDIYRWQRASHKENSRGYKSGDTKVPDEAVMNYANPNYTNFKGGVDPEFMRAKMIRHALKKLGTNLSETKGSKLNLQHKQIVSAEAAATESQEEFVHYTEVASDVNIDSTKL